MHYAPPSAAALEANWPRGQGLDRLSFGNKGVTVSDRPGYPSLVYLHPGSNAPAGDFPPFYC
jgi:hypothetical protein